MFAEHEHLTPEALAEALAYLDHELADGQARLDEQRARHHRAYGELKGVRGLASDLSWELEDLEQRIHELATQREGPGDRLLDRELASMASRRAELEERVLAQMLLVDELAARVAAEAQALGDQERDWAARQKELAAERERLARHGI
jgi:hypothetical protein